MCEVFHNVSVKNSAECGMFYAGNNALSGGYMLLLRGKQNL